LEQIGIPRSTFYRWCDLYQTGGPEALEDCSPRPDRVWNRIPDDVRARIVTLALDEPELSEIMRFARHRIQSLSERPVAVSK
jgi:putative transposase